MKKCPSCEKTFEDSMRFCQVDGTPLVDDAPAFDPYATIVAPPVSSTPFEVVEPVVEESVSSIELVESEAATQIAAYPSIEAPIAEPDDVLDLPAPADPLKTMYVSDDEMKQALGGHLSEEPLMEIPSIAPEPPTFIAPEITPPPSPFAAETPNYAVPMPFEEPSPVGLPQLSDPEPVSYNTPTFQEPEPTFSSPVSSPFEQSSVPAEWTPPPAPDASWQNQEIGANTPFQPPPAGTGTQSQGMAIASLVLGILSCLCCVSVITGPIGVILGFIAKKKATEDPANFTGAGLALGGMITGAIGFVLGFVLIILQIFFGVLSNIR